MKATTTVIPAFLVSIFACFSTILFADTLVLKDGREYEITRYEVRGSLVHITSLESKKYSIRADLIDFPATKEANRGGGKSPASGRYEGREVLSLAEISRQIRDRRGDRGRKQRSFSTDVFQREEEKIGSIIGRDDIGIPQTVYEDALKEETVYPANSLYLARVSNSARIEEYLKVSPSIRNAFRSLMDFNIRKYMGREVTSASLNIHVDQQSGAGSEPTLVRLGLITDMWNEQTLQTWRDCPTYIELDSSTKLEGSGWYSLDVTKAVQAYCTKGVDAFFGFLLFTQEQERKETGLKWINSNRFRQPEFWPRLIVTSLAPEAEAKKELAPIADLWVDQNKNEAHRKEGDLKLSGQFRHNAVAFLKFDMSEAKDQIINDAKLALYLIDSSIGKGTMHVQVGVPKRTWNYATLTGWNTAPVLGTEGPSMNVPGTPGWHEVDITALARWAAYEEKTHGFMLYTTQNDYARFHSTRSDAVNRRPKLTINATPKVIETVHLSGSKKEKSKEMLVDRILSRLLADILENPDIVRALKISFIPGMILGLLTLRWVEKRFSFLIGSGIVFISVLSVIIAERYG